MKQLAVQAAATDQTCVWQEVIDASSSAESWTAWLLGLLLRNTLKVHFEMVSQVCVSHLRQRRDLILNPAVLHSAATLVIHVGAFTGLLLSCFLTLAVVNETMLEKALLSSLSTTKQTPLQLEKNYQLNTEHSLYQGLSPQQGALQCAFLLFTVLQHMSVQSLQPSWKPRAAEVGRGLWRSPSATPCSQRGQLAQDCPVGF